MCICRWDRVRQRRLIPVPRGISQGSSTTARSSDSKVAHSSGWQTGQGWQLGLTIGVPLFLSTGCLGFPTAWWWSSKSKCQSKNKNKQDTRGVEAASLLRSGPRNCHNVLSTVFYCSSNHGARGKGQGHRLHLPMGRGSQMCLKQPWTSSPITVPPHWT